MTSVVAIFIRFVAILAGYAVASLAASAFLHLIVLGPLEWTNEEAAWVASGSAFVSVPVFALFVGYFAFLPSIPVILASEVLARRDWLFHVLCGGGVALVVAALFLADAARAGDPSYDPAFLAVVVAAGLVGGFGYWLVAGRGAGAWRMATSPTRSES